MTKKDETVSSTMKYRALPFAVAVAFAIIGAFGLWLYASIPYIPPTSEVYTLVQAREIGGNGTYLFGVLAASILAGCVSLISLVMACADSSHYER